VGGGVGEVRIIVWLAHILLPALLGLHSQRIGLERILVN
jgi:hypothetical protein